MIVEDDYNVARSLAWSLSSFGAEIIGPAPNVAKALELVAEHRFDVAVLDVQLRGETVAAVAERLHDDGIPMVFLTGFRDLQHLPGYLRSHPRVDKPAHAPTLISTILKEIAEP